MLIILILATPKFKFLTKEETQQFILVESFYSKKYSNPCFKAFKWHEIYKQEKTFTQPLCGDVVGNPESWLQVTSI